MIPSHAKELQRRQAVRRTWFQYLTSARCVPCREFAVKAIFVIGKEGFEIPEFKSKIEEEIAQNGDVGILPNFSQKYYKDRAMKTKLSIKYAVDNYNFTLLLKADTDSWVFMDKMLEYLQRRVQDIKTPTEGSVVYAGNFREGRGSKPISNKTSKWFDPLFSQATGMEISTTCEGRWIRSRSQVV